MANRFSLGKTDTVSVVEEQDLLDIEAIDQCDDQIWYDVLKKKAYEPFTTGMLETADHQDQDENSMTNFNPWKFNFESKGGIGDDIYFNFTSATNCQIVVCPDTFPFYDTFAAVTEGSDSANKYSGSYGTTWATGATLKNTITNFFKQNNSRPDKDQQIQQLSSQSWAYPSSIATPICVMDHMSMSYRGRVDGTFSGPTGWAAIGHYFSGYSGGAKTEQQLGFFNPDNTSYTVVSKAINFNMAFTDFHYLSLIWGTHSTGGEQQPIGVKWIGQHFIEMTR